MTAYTIDTHETVRQLAAAGIKDGTYHQIGRKATRSVVPQAGTVCVAGQDAQPAPRP